MPTMITATIREVHEITRACVDAGRPEWDTRTNAYWRAYSRRLARELGTGAWHREASECLIALSGAMCNRVMP